MRKVPAGITAKYSPAQRGVLRHRRWATTSTMWPKSRSAGSVYSRPRTHPLTLRDTERRVVAAGVGGAAAPCGQGCPEAKVRRREPAYAVDVRRRDDERAAGREHATRLAQDRVGSRGVVLGDAERDLRGGRAVAQRQRRQLGRRQRCL